MSKTIIAGNAVVITSDLKLDDLKTVAKYRPNALKLVEEVDGHKEEVFAVSVGKNNGGISKFGATFGRSNADGYAQITMVTVDNPADMKQYVVDEFGVALNALNKLEANITAALTGICEERNAVLNSIEIAE